MSAGLPEPGSVAEAAAEVSDHGGVNLLVSGAADAAFDAIGLDNDAYRGPASGTAGRLAAATAALDRLEGANLHYPSPDLDVPGPWIVVEPLASRLATVSRGRATVTVELVPPAGHPDARLRAVRDRLDSVIEAARPRHDVYPVDRDEFAAFTPGLPVLELRAVELDGAFSATFDALTTPDTDAEALRDRFRAVDGVERATVEVEVEVERASPSGGLREAAEAATAEVVGDWNYEWLAQPTAFARVHSADKIALGTGEPGAGRFGAEAFATCRDLLVETVTRLEVENA